MKTSFLKEAQKKYKEQLKIKFVSEMNFIFSNKLILRVWFDVNFLPNKEFGETGFVHKWCTVETLPSQSDEKIERLLGAFISNDGEHYPAIVKVLREELPTNQDELIDNIKFGKSDDDTISPIEKLEFSLTVKELCDMIGIG